MCSSRHCTIFVPHSRRRSIGQVATNSAHELIRSVVHLLKALQPCGCPRSVTGDPRQSMKRLSNPGPVWGGSQDGLAHFLVGRKWNDWSICLQSVRVEQLRNMSGHAISWSISLELVVESYLWGSKIEQHSEEHETIAVLGDDAISDHRVALAQQSVHHRDSPWVAWSGQSRPQNRVRNQQGTWTSKPAPIGGVACILLFQQHQPHFNITRTPSRRRTESAFAMIDTWYEYHDIKW